MKSDRYGGEVSDWMGGTNGGRKGEMDGWEGESEKVEKGCRGWGWTDGWVGGGVYGIERLREGDGRGGERKVRKGE